jgi:PadR family transcriptional regulator, regulatory protein PadR
VSGLTRITNPLLDVVEVLHWALMDGEEELHGWAIMKTTKRTGPTVYGVLDRLEEAGWITGHWEEQPPEANKPRRRFYQLTPTGRTAVRDLLAERRPKALERRPRPAGKPGLALIGRFHVLWPGGAR